MNSGNLKNWLPLTGADAGYSEEFLSGLLRTMLRIRFCEESLVEPILQGEILTPCHLCTGQEAVAVGLCAALEEKDVIFGNHRSHGHYLAKGGSLEAMIAEIFCREDGCCAGRGGSMHVTSLEVGMLGAAPIVAGTVSLAVGAGLASKIRNDGLVAVSFFGDGAVGEGVLYESLNFAALKHLPVVFVCENNLYATHMPVRECRVDRPIREIAAPFGIVNATVDGNDVLAVYEAGKAAAALCRAGNGPVFLEFQTYRLRGHVGPDDNIQGLHTDIRPTHEVQEWHLRDPIRKIEEYLLEKALKSTSDLAALRIELARETEAAINRARNGRFPSPDRIMDYTFRD